MPKHLNPNRAKIHRNYTVEEVANLFSIHKNTVRTWIKNGLPVCDERRPILILGAQLRAYLQEKRQSRKHKCRIDEMFCMRCRCPRRPAADMVDLATCGQGNLQSHLPASTSNRRSKNRQPTLFSPRSRATYRTLDLYRVNFFL